MCAAAAAVVLVAQAECCRADATASRALFPQYLSPLPSSVESRLHACQHRARLGEVTRRRCQLRVTYEGGTLEQHIGSSKSLGNSRTRICGDLKKEIERSVT